MQFLVVGRQGVDEEGRGIAAEVAAVASPSHGWPQALPVQFVERPTQGSGSVRASMFPCCFMP
jgi:hypothetical protein